ncbi:MAG TPA: asparaginase, partial [Hyphomicrobiaceae bacterium]|nr:asparaginase [Hyphomicrobiaceae bacterium]
MSGLKAIRISRRCVFEGGAALAAAATIPVEQATKDEDRLVPSIPPSLVTRSNPVLIELTRGPVVESVHTGALALARPTGELLLALGDVGRPIFPRSAIKSLQCLPLIESGAADRFGFGDAEIALACASHTGTARHVHVATGMLERIGLTQGALACGVHPPQSTAAQKQLAIAGTEPSALHNNCSGKHAGMLATAVHLGEPIDNYWRPDHPVQLRVRETLEDFTGCSLAAEVRGIDGCSAPNWAIPLAALARAFACFVTGEGAGAKHRLSAQRIAEACWAKPKLVAGAGRLDTRVMRRWPGQAFTKTGAEGVYCGGLPDLGIGFALKVDDGAGRASEAVVLRLLEHLLPGAAELDQVRTLKNWRGLEVGERRASATLTHALE